MSGEEAFLEWDFPVPASCAPLSCPPAAFLSRKSEGDMRYRFPGSAGNRGRFLRELGLDESLVLGVALAHSRKVLVRTEGAERLFDEGGRELESPVSASGHLDAGYDGILLLGSGLAASVTVADCMPIYLCDFASGAFGVLHSGWKGTGILATAVAVLAAVAGSPASAISIILGPAIGPCCYSVPEERALGFAREFGPSAALRRDGSSYLDLRAANLALASRLGVGAVSSADLCTSCDLELGSYRREGSASFTRMLALAARPPEGR
jgi:polyphenol oxidase